MQPDPGNAVERVRDALLRRELTVADLSARRLGRFLGRTASLLYRVFGSRDRFLYAVSIAGHSLLGDQIEAAARGPNALQRIAELYVEWVRDHPALFHLLFEYPFDWADLRAAHLIDENQGLRGWRTVARLFRKDGSGSPESDARLFWAAAHGIGALTRSGLMNAGDLAHTDQEVAIRTMRRLVHLFRRRNR